MKRLGSFSITANESRDFARGSGDFNPLHLDPVAARRTRFGQTLIHGVCGTIRALDLLLQDTQAKAILLGIKVKYSKPVSQGQELTVFGATKESMTRLEVFAGGVRCQIIDLELVEGTVQAYGFDPQRLADCSDNSGLCTDLAIDDCEGLSGAVDLVWDNAIMQALFPSAAHFLPREQLATLLASTQIVGMKCPGLHSVFAQLDLRFLLASTAPGIASAPLEYRVLNIDKRIDRVVLGIGNPIAQGTVEAFFRPPPAQQASFERITSLVPDTEFRQQNALIVGGSRGLGEVITKVLAAGGATVLMTYAMGRDDAARVCAEIGKTRTAPGVCLHNVLQGPLSTEMAELCASVTHIYYLASPLIAKGESNNWDASLFSRYCAYYIDGLATLLQHVQAQGPGSRKLHLFIPSSVFLDESIKGFEEYIAAKAAAEAYVRSFAAAHRNWRVVAPRLPRLHTDQTSGLKDTDEQRTLDVIIERLRLAFADDQNPTTSGP